MIRKIQIYFLLFITYALLGWSMEVICKLIELKKFVNRGFLLGPYCPIYGWGALLITILLQKFNNNLVILFILSLIICSILEYSTSYLLEKIFKARWWDYSNKKFNINGRICLNTLIPFGLLGVIIIHFINPLLYNIYSLINPILLNVLTGILFILFLIDNIISFKVLLNIRHDNILLKKDSTEEMAKKVIAKLKERGFLHKRLLFAFPDFKYIIKIKKKK